MLHHRHVRSSCRSATLTLALACLAAALPACGAGIFDATVSTTGSYATTCATTTYEAETMVHSTDGAVANGWNIWSNGNISTQHDFFPGSTRIDVVASGTSAAGLWPHMVVTVNGQQVGQATVSSTSALPLIGARLRLQRAPGINA